jgi:hypothetical protein
MGLGLGIAICLIIFIVVGFLVFQARFAARRWRQVIAAGDLDALGELLDMTFEAWRNSRPPRGLAPADWRALHTAALVAADRDRARVSLLAEPDVRVTGGRRVEEGTAQDVARRAAVRMVERLMYEVPHVSFAEVQVDVHTEYRGLDGSLTDRCLLTTRVTRDGAAYADWETRDAIAMLAEWETREAAGGRAIDPEDDALLPAPAPEALDAIDAAERALQEERLGREGRA